MVSPAAAAVVLVPFPFSDLSRSKLRPAVVIADAGRGDWVLCQVASKPYGDPRAIPLSDSDFRFGARKVASFARPSKTFTADQSLIVAHVGVLTEGRFRDRPSRVIACWIRLMFAKSYSVAAANKAMQPAALRTAADRQR